MAESGFSLVSSFSIRSKAMACHGFRGFAGFGGIVPRQDKKKTPAVKQAFIPKILLKQ
jgi:hypothetical protein